MKKSTRLYWIAGITGAIVGTSALAGASPGTDYSADSYDLALLSDASIASPASALPDDFDFANLDDEIDPGTLRLVGTTGHASIFTAFSAAGELCVISSIDVSADDWTVGSACQSPDSFNARGAALRMISPTESVEAYLLPDSAVAALFAYSVFYPAVEGLSTVAVAGLVAFGGLSILAGTLSFGVFIAFWYYAYKFFMPVRELAEKYNILQAAMASSERVFGILDSPADPDLASSGGIPELKGDVEFRWPKIEDGVMRLTAAQLSALLEGLDWRRVHEMRRTRIPIEAS